MFCPFFQYHATGSPDQRGDDDVTLIQPSLRKAHGRRASQKRDADLHAVSDLQDQQRHEQGRQRIEGSAEGFAPFRDYLKNKLASGGR